MGKWRVLVLEAAHGAVTTALASAGPFCAERLDWHGLSLEQLRRITGHLLVFVLDRTRPGAVETLRSLCVKPLPMPILAVLECSLPEDWLRAAAAADDFCIWPVRKEELRQRIERLLGPRGISPLVVEARLNEEFGLRQLVGNDPAFVRVLERVRIVARGEATVLLTGETGTGKELCARAIHHLGRRRAYPFIPLDCGGVPDHLFENELFGHARGAFTDAHEAHGGLVAMAEGGTLFIDEVDALSASAQAKLLRFLQEHTYRPLGSDHFRHADVRVIAAVNRDPESCVREKQLRADLYYRLNVLRVELPPLRARPSDIPLLSEHFLACLNAESGAPKVFSRGAIEKLAAHPWPGNVRELLNVVQRAVAFCESSEILPHHVSLEPQGAEPHRLEAGDYRTARDRTIQAFERAYVEEALRKHGGNITRAARAAGQDRRAFGRLVKKYRTASVCKFPAANG